MILGIYAPTSKALGYRAKKKAGIISKGFVLRLTFPMFIEIKVSSAFFNFWSAGITVLLACPQGDIIFAQLACPVHDIIFCLHWE
jgi:hypothetical protein